MKAAGDGGDPAQWPWHCICLCAPACPSAGTTTGGRDKARAHGTSGLPTVTSWDTLVSQ